jgi:hypothetical protein
LRAYAHHLPVGHFLLGTSCWALPVGHFLLGSVSLESVLSTDLTARLALDRTQVPGPSARQSLCREWVRTDPHAAAKAHSNTVESGDATFKRAIAAVCHWLSIKHLDRYCTDGVPLESPRSATPFLHCSAATLVACRGRRSSHDQSTQRDRSRLQGAALSDCRASRPPQPVGRFSALSLEPPP